MAELLVRLVDKVNKVDIYSDCQLTKRGDVICIQPDGWTWGKDEVTAPFYQIVRLPGVDPNALSALLQPEIDTDPKNPSRTLQRRGFKFDLDALLSAKTINPVDVDRVSGLLGETMLTSTTPMSTVMTPDKGTTPAFIQPNITPRDVFATECVIDAVDVQTYIVQKPPVADPSVIGKSDAVIG